jgi:hypothetical protein
MLGIEMEMEKGSKKINNNNVKNSKKPSNVPTCIDKTRRGN